MAIQRFDQHRPPRDDRQLDALGLALADDRERQFAVPGRFLNQILKLEAQILLDLHHADVVDLSVADLGDHVPGLQGIIGLGFGRRVHDHPLRLFVETKKAPKRGVFQGLKRVVYGGLAFALTVGDVFEKKLDLLGRNDVADVVGLGQLAEDQADHLAVDQGRPAAVARVDGRVDLDPDTADSVVVAGELDPGDDPLGDRQARTTLWVAVNHHAVLDLGKSLNAHQWRPLVEERLVLELEDCQVHPWAYRFHIGCQLFAGLLAFHAELAGVEDHVSVGENSLAANDDSRSACLARALLGPGMEDVGIAQGRRDLDDRLADRAFSSAVRRLIIVTRNWRMQSRARHEDQRHPGHPGNLHRRNSLGVPKAGYEPGCRQPDVLAAEKSAPRRDLTAEVQETTESYLNP